MCKQQTVKPTDVDVAQLYDGFSIITVVWLEALGFVGRGESGPFLEGGANIARDGVLPLNTNGGQLSEAYIHGLNHVVEGVRSLRDESTSPVAGAEVCLVTSGACVPSSALLLGRR